jgi:hypothetical protein
MARTVLVAVRLFLGGGNDWYPDSIAKIGGALSCQGLLDECQPPTRLMCVN